MSVTSRSTPFRPLLGALILRGMGFGLVWWALMEGDMTGWWVGIVATAGAMAASLALVRPMRGRIRAIGVLQFARYFLVQSFLGGLDVARRAFHPRLPIAPGVFVRELQYSTGAMPVLVADTLSLLPGTVGAGFENDRLVIHVLDRSMPLDDRLATLEATTSAMFASEERPS